ncbi:hypothetical protein JX266_002632 [Neoarthrinium moseri]|nr:hypothetical protein JX266_002632 [Neoarthrinium moseri]
MKMKAVEGKVRAQTQDYERFPKHAAKIFIHQTVLYESGLQIGQRCIIESTLANDRSRRREAVAWNSVDKALAKSVIVLSSVMKAAAGLELGDSIRVSSAGEVPEAQTVVVRDVTPHASPVVPEEQKSWSWNIEAALEKADYVFPGLALENIVGKGPKRSFVVETVNGRKDNVAKYCSSTRAKWPGDDAVEVDGAPGKLEIVDILPGMQAPVRALNRFFRNFYTDYPPAFAAADPSCAIVVEGSQGTGKSKLLEQVAATRWGRVIRVDDGDKPAAIQEHFRNALDSEEPHIILIDDIQNLVGETRANREGATKAIRRGLEELAGLTAKNGQRPKVAVVASCRNFLEDLPESLRKPGHFDECARLAIPDTSVRKDIIRLYAANVFPAAEAEQYISDVGDRTHAYTGEDLVRLLARALRLSQTETGESTGPQPTSWAGLQQALQEVRPSAMHDINLKPPSVRWKDIGGYQEVKSTLQVALSKPQGGIALYKPSKGVLLYGPPGCSKTMTAQAMATESGFNFFSVKGGELLNMYVGETERSIRNLFARARAACPSIIFFDEIDSIAGSRGVGGGSAGGGAGLTTALTTLLTEMDGFEQLGDVFVLAATNKPESLDPALIRAGRFDQLIYVPLPDDMAREAIITRKARELKFPDVDIGVLVKQTDGYSGAEITQICDQAFKPLVGQDGTTDGGADAMQMLEAAIKRTPKGVTSQMLAHFVAWRLSMSMIG